MSASDDGKIFLAIAHEIADTLLSEADPEIIAEVYDLDEDHTRAVVGTISGFRSVHTSAAERLRTTVKKPTTVPSLPEAIRNASNEWLVRQIEHMASGETDRQICSEIRSRLQNQQ